MLALVIFQIFLVASARNVGNDGAVNTTATYAASGWYSDTDVLSSNRAVTEYGEVWSRFAELWRDFPARECLPPSPAPPANTSASSRYIKRHIEKSLLLNHDLPDTHWHEYKSVYNKSYASSQHEDSALAAWRDNLRHVAAHNRDYLAGAHKYSLHLNHFADLSLENYMKKVLKLIAGKKLHDPAHDSTGHKLHNTPAGPLPLRMDWRQRGFSPRLEEQWRCGACYAFAIAHAVQAQLYRTHKDGRELSVQQLVDCSSGDGNYGCGGGSLAGALRYASRAGLELEADYPYLGKAGVCKYRSAAVRARVARWSLLPAGDELAMARAVAHIGPLAVAINASPKTFQLYRSGVYDDATCLSQVNHAMLLVGYTPKYWILMNWWGLRWGEKGYMRIRRGVNRCGLATSAAYVEIV